VGRDSPQWLQLDVLKPAGRAVVLQADVSSVRMILERNVEFVIGAVGPFVGPGELAHIHASDDFAVQVYRDQIGVAGDFEMIPFTDRLHGVTGGLYPIVKRPGIW